MHKLFLIAAAMLFTSATHATEQIALQPGLYEIAAVTTTQPGAIVTQSKSFLCRTSTYDDFAAAQLKVSAPGCSTLSDVTANNSHTVLSACQTKLFASFTSSLFVVLTNRSAHAETETSYNPLTAGILTVTRVEDQHYVSACPTGMQPGDLTLANGTVQHLWTH